jgi:hypothetical protein
MLFVVCCLLFVVCCLLFVVCCLLFVVCCLLFVVCRLLFVVCCLLFVVCCLLFRNVSFIQFSGEDLRDAVVREVKEETGIITEFESVLCFRQMKGFSFGLYVYYTYSPSTFFLYLFSNPSLTFSFVISTSFLFYALTLKIEQTLFLFAS